MPRPAHSHAVSSRWDQLLTHWLRWFVPIAVSVAAIWWLLTDVLGIVGAA